MFCIDFDQAGRTAWHPCCETGCCGAEAVQAIAQEVLLRQRKVQALVSDCQTSADGTAQHHIQDRLGNPAAISGGHCRGTGRVQSFSLPGTYLSSMTTVREWEKEIREWAIFHPLGVSSWVSSHPGLGQAEVGSWEFPLGFP